jgi:hypothetical protein
VKRKGRVWNPEPLPHLHEIQPAFKNDALADHLRIVFPILLLYEYNKGRSSFNFVICTMEEMNETSAAGVWVRADGVNMCLFSENRGCYRLARTAVWK